MPIDSVCAGALARRARDGLAFPPWLGFCKHKETCCVFRFETKIKVYFRTTIRCAAQLMFADHPLALGRRHSREPRSRANRIEMVIEMWIAHVPCGWQDLETRRRLVPAAACVALPTIQSYARSLGRCVRLLCTTGRDLHAPHKHLAVGRALVWLDAAVLLR